MKDVIKNSRNLRFQTLAAVEIIVTKGDGKMFDQKTIERMVESTIKKGVQKETWYLKEKIEELERRIQKLEEEKNK
ncbi:hypothetical protein [Kurthia sp. Dielmo]|uniref:hypothetical protein n=1 Tax=Kurthia sp. Dielmo TaxID=1033738 RepID=UPI00111DAD3D|nr:hypothetical protein [Kurthia sp. Dielmo]